MDLPIFQENLRSSGGWATDLARAQKDWLGASPQARSRITDLQVTQGLARASLSGVISSADAYFEAAQFISEWAGASGAGLDANRLQAVNAALLGNVPSSGVLRTGAGQRLSEYHNPAPAIILPRLLENALDWFETKSFSEIHPVEQAAVVFLRLADLQPFDQLNEETALLAASLFLERASLPPLIVGADEATMSEYNNALEGAFRMLTQPLVEFLSKTLIKTIGQANV